MSETTKYAELNHPGVEKHVQLELEAAAFRRLVQHMRDRVDVQNIDLMNMAGFCRNCLSNWYREAAAERDITIDKLAAREIIYGMPYDEWQKAFQKEASDAQQKAFEENKPEDH